MGKKKLSRAGRPPVAAAGQAPGPVPASLLQPPGVVITKPEDLDPAQFLPYEKADRMPAGALQQLEALAAEKLGIPTGVLVGYRGEVCDEGSVALFSRADTEVETPRFWVVIGARPSSGTPLFLAQFETRSAAEATYERRRRLLG